MTFTYQLHFFDLPLHHTFTIAHGSRTVQKTLILSLSAEGVTGFGEAPDIAYYPYRREQTAETIKKAVQYLNTLTFTDPITVWHILQPIFGDNSFAACLLDIALHDWAAKKQQKPLYQLFGLSLQNLPVTDYTIGIDSIEIMQEKIRNFPAPIYKIKLGTPQDEAIIHALRQITDAPFRIDANCGWTVTKAIELSEKFADLNVQYIEQPLPKHDHEGMRTLHRHTRLPIFADESCLTIADLPFCATCFEGINIKLTKCGGLTPALTMIAEARKYGLSIMAGCMNESTVGISAVAQLLPLIDHADMDGALLLAKDTTQEGVRFKNCIAHFPDTNGIGVITLEIDNDNILNPLM
jgi:L-alanine-DL-glutamate epimerase-like enolase superfamily enzyme